jgi:hypothetical protein
MSTKRTIATETDDLATEIALFRYGLIAALVHTPPDQGRQEALLREIAARTYRIPGSTRTQVSLTTLRRYLQTYRDHGFDALRPSPRADAGTPRAFPSEVLAKAIALRHASRNPRAPRKPWSTFCNAIRPSPCRSRSTSTP